MSVQNTNAVKYAELTDEIITDVAKGIELFVEDEAYWAKFAHQSPVKRGAKTFTFRRLVKPRVRKEDVHESAEFVAPRPSKIAVETFEKTVGIYRFKAIYSKEDLMYHFDDTLNNIRATLREEVRQSKEFIYGKPFVNSACTVTYDTSILNTLDKAAIILRKNDANRWDGTHYLAHVTPEILKTIRGEIRALGQSISEDTKGKLDKNIVGSFGDWLFSVTTSDLLYKNDSTQIMVLMGKRKVDGNSPVDISKMQGESDLEMINKGLGSGVLVDEDGNYTADDNNQQGAVACNINGVGAAVNDDLCILNCEVSVNAIKGNVLNHNDKTGAVTDSVSPYAKVTIKAVDSTGATISNPTITYKVKSSTGATIAADKLLAGDTYYVSVSGNSKSATLTFVANAVNNFTLVLA